MVHTLRDGSTVKDPRLDRIAQFDDRSRKFPVRKLFKSTSPRNYTWRCRQYLDQGTEGACVGFGITHELIARPAEVQGMTYDNAFKIYKAAQFIDPWEGEDYEGTSVLAGLEVTRKLGYFDGYYWCFGIEDVIMALSYKGPVVLGIPWMSGMFTPDADGVITATGYASGGHCILATSIKIVNGVVWIRLHNSWGISWGVGGDCWITAEDLEKLLLDGGEAAVVIGRHKEVAA